MTCEMSHGRRDARAAVRLALVIGLGTIALVAMHLWIGRDASVPRRSGPGDQWGYLGNARYLADSGPTWVLPEFPYFGYGYSALLVPAFRLFDDPERLFLAVRVTNALLLAFVFPLLVLFCVGYSRLRDGLRSPAGSPVRWCPVRSLIRRWPWPRTWCCHWW